MSAVLGQGIVVRHAYVVATAYPIGVAAATLAGLTLQEWTYVTAITAGISSIVYTGFRAYLDWREVRAQRPKPTVPPNR